MKGRILRCGIIAACTLLCLSSIAQNNQELDDKYTPNQNSIFNTLLKKPGSTSLNDIEITNAIQFSPTLLLRQKIALFYERSMGGPFSMVFGIGKAFGDDIFQTMYLNGFTFDNQNNVLSASEMMNNASYSGSSMLLSGAFRIYFSGQVFGDGFMDFCFRNEGLDYRIGNMVNGYRVEGLDLLNVKMNAFYFGFGHTWLGGVKDNVVHNIYLNFGMKMLTLTKFVFTESNGENVYRRTPDVITQRVLPAINMGYVIGFGF